MAFLRGLPLSFQRQAAGNLDAVYHFTFTGTESREATVTIRAGTIKVETSRIGTSKLHVAADSQTWLGFLAKEKNLLWALLTRKIRLRGNPRWLLKFSRCFPS
jgi:putative sterol carrier protein